MRIFCRSISRRRFLAGSAASAAAFTIVPRDVLGAGRTPPSEKISIAFIGVAGRGAANLAGLGSQNVVALCDVDSKRLGGAAGKHASAKTFKDFRRMLDAVENQIDAVSVSTPDHTHSVCVMNALKRKKHVYCEKPLAHSIWEVRQIMQAATAAGVVTQLGNQGHSFDAIRMFVEWVRDGAIGNVHTIHAACGSNYSRIKQLSREGESHPVPPNLDWDLWLGPAKFRQYNPMYCPGIWRGWTPFGTGVIGDWTCHVVDPVFWALDLGAPESIQAQAKGYDPKADFDTFPAGSHIVYKFAARGKRGPVTLHWHDGSDKIPFPEGLEKDRKVPDIGAVVLGDKGGITYGSHGATGVRIFPESKMRAYKLPPKTIPRAPRNEHHQDFLQAIRTGRKAGSDMPTYGGPLTEIALLGIIATHLLGQELKWDGEAAKFTNSSDANKLIKPEFRSGWTL